VKNVCFAANVDAFVGLESPNLANITFFIDALTISWAGSRRSCTVRHPSARRHNGVAILGNEAKSVVRVSFPMDSNRSNALHTFGRLLELMGATQLTMDEGNSDEQRRHGGGRFVALSFAQNFLRGALVHVLRQDRNEAHVDDAFLEQRLLLGAQNMAPTHSACLE
jgi:hypothetical protein